MKILLINPPTTNEQIPENPPLGLLYLASMLRKEHDVWVMDLDALKYSEKQIEHRLIKESPDVIGITATTFSYNGMKELCNLAKKVLPETKVILGGPHVSAKPAESLNETGADFVMIGEGELSIMSLLESIEEENRSIIEGEKEENLDNLPFPSRDLLEPDITYYQGNAPRHVKPETVMVWSRGCPHTCLFCSNVIYYGQKIRFRPPNSIVSEIKVLKEMGTEEIFVYDDELVGMDEEQTRWLQDVCRLIIKEGLDDIVFKCQGRCSKFVDLETLRLMKRAGFRTIMWGCESGSDKVLRALRKGMKVSDIERSIKICKKASIEAWMFLMVGNYKETAEDAEKTLKLVKRLKPDFVQVTYATPYPSDFEKMCIEKNLIIEPDRSRWDTNIPVAKSEYLSIDEMVHYRNKMLITNKVLRLRSIIIKKLLKMEFPYKHYFNLFYQNCKNYGFTHASKRALRYASTGFK